MQDEGERIALPQYRWADSLRAVGEPGSVRPAFQPIVDLRRGFVVGYEMLARFTGPPDAPPDVWFDQAAKHGIADELEARLVRTGLEARSALPANCFLTINIGPSSLDSPQVQAALAGHGRLHGVVIELTEHSRADDEMLEHNLRALRERGAMIAIDDVGAGYSGLQRIVRLRPEFVKIDRSLVTGLHADAAKREMVESLGAVANRIDAWVVAEGIEETAELEALMRLNVPLGQGFALARPEPTMKGPAIGLTSWIQERRDEDGRSGRRGWILTDRTPLLHDSWEINVRQRLREEPATRHLPVVDERGRPVGLIARDRYARGEGALTAPLSALAGEDPAHLARRAMARSPETRFDPVLLCDEVGRYVALIEIDGLIEVLVERHPDPERV